MGFHIAQAKNQEVSALSNVTPACHELSPPSAPAERTDPTPLTHPKKKGKRGKKTFPPSVPCVVVFISIVASETTQQDVGPGLKSTKNVNL